MAQVKGVSVEFGISIAVGDKTWVKATAGMEVTFDPGDKTDEVFEMGWNRVTHEVSQQIQNFGAQVVDQRTGDPVK